MLVELDEVIRWLKENLYDYQHPALDYLLGTQEWEEISTDLREYFKEKEG